MSQGKWRSWKLTLTAASAQDAVRLHLATAGWRFRQHTPQGTSLKLTTCLRTGRAGWHVFGGAAGKEEQGQVGNTVSLGLLIK